MSGNSARALAIKAFLHRTNSGGIQFLRPMSSPGNTKPTQANAAAAIVTNFLEMVRYLPNSIYNKMQISASEPPQQPPPPTTSPSPKKSSEVNPNQEQKPEKSISTKSTEAKVNAIEIQDESPPPSIHDIEPPEQPNMTSTSSVISSIQSWQHLEARTRYLVSVLEKHLDGVPPHELIHDVEALFAHIYANEGTRDVAIHRGVYKSLFKILKLHDADTSLINRTRELLALLGYNPPVKGRGIRILSLDGGGIRGLVAIEVLRVLERLTGKRTHELFDYICGVSTGSILAFLIGVHSKSLDEAEALYKESGREIFNQNSWYGTASLLWFHSYYHTGTFETILKKQIGEAPMISHARNKDLPRVSAISTIVNQENISPYVFRTYTLPVGVRRRHPGGFRYEMWEAVRASAAAPTYFNEHKLGKHLHQDGGVMCNNPTSIALSESKAIWQGSPIQCVVSIGTGRTLRSHPNQHHYEFHSNVNDSSTPQSLSWKGKFLKVLDSATDTESVHHTLNELLPSDVYFRFNPYLLGPIPKLDEAIPEKLEKLQEGTRDYLERNIERAILASETLNKKKSTVSRVSEYFFNY